MQIILEQRQSFATATHCLKITQNVAFECLNFGIFTNFCPIKTDLSGNTANFRLSKTRQNGPFWVFLSTQNVSVARFARNVE